MLQLRKKLIKHGCPLLFGKHFIYPCPQKVSFGYKNDNSTKMVNKKEPKENF